MDERSLNIMMDIFVGETISPEDSKYIKSKNAKYELVRFLINDKMQHDDLGLKDFHFTVGYDFENRPIIDIVNEFLRIFENLKKGDYDVVDGPPQTGMEKTKL